MDLVQQYNCNRSILFHIFIFFTDYSLYYINTYSNLLTVSMVLYYYNVSLRLGEGSGVNVVMALSGTQTCVNIP